MAADPTVATLTGGAGRGSTVLCLGVGAPVLHTVAAIIGATGLVLLVGPDPAPDAAWSTVRCDPPAAIPIRSHVIDAAIVSITDHREELAAELRRVLAPGGGLRVLTSVVSADEVEAALCSADIRPLRRVAVVADELLVLVARGP